MPGQGSSRTSRPCLSRSASSPLDSSSTRALMPGRGVPAEPGFMACAPGSVVIMIWPVSVCHHVSTTGAWQAADDLPVPQPRLWVDRLADRAEEADAREVVLLGVLAAPLHAGADRRRRGVEDRDLVAIDELPPDVLARVVRRALVHHRRGPVGERAVDDVAVAGDPADVGRAPVHVVLGLEVED